MLADYCMKNKAFEIFLGTQKKKLFKCWACYNFSITEKQKRLLSRANLTLSQVY